MSDERDLFDNNSDDEAVLPGTGLPGKRRKSFKASEAPADSKAESSAEPKEDAPEKNQAQHKPTPVASASPKAKRRGFDWLLLFPLLIMLAAAYGGWQWYQAMLEPALDTVTENRDNLSVLGERQQVVLEQQSELIDAIKQQATQDVQWQRVQEEKLALLQSRMNRLDRSARSQALLVEIGGLMRQADRLIRFEKDLPTAAATLRLVDKLLQELDDSGADYVRGVLANDLQHIKSALSVDRQLVYVQLDQLMKGVDDWALRQTPRTHFSAPGSEAIDENLQGFQKYWQALLARLKTLVIIRPRDVRDQPMLPPEQSWFLRENLRLQLQQAQWGALHAQPVVFNRSIKQANRWLDKYFDPQQADVAQAREQLAALMKTSVGMPSIDISATQKALASYQFEMTATQSGEAGQ